MLVVLDPGFFREDGIEIGDAPWREAASRRLRHRLDHANALLMQPGTQLVVAVDKLAWFDDVFRAQVKSLELGAERPLKQAFARLLEHRKRGRTLPGVVLTGTMWGVVQMAQWPTSQRSWRPELERVLAASVVTAAREGVPVVFLCHRIEGRNIRDRSSNSVELVEVLRWRLSVSIRGAMPALIPCVGQLRHLDVPWTRRMDDRLPDVHGPDLHPYCPPSGWAHARTKVWGTHASRPCWLDAQGQWWARPATGGGYHWDVYLNHDEEQRIGLSQINVTRHGVPIGEGAPGDLHHVPKKKRQAIQTSSGWRCPG